MRYAQCLSRIVAYLQPCGRFHQQAHGNDAAQFLDPNAFVPLQKRKFRTGGIHNRVRLNVGRQVAILPIGGPHAAGKVMNPHHAQGVRIGMRIQFDLYDFNLVSFSGHKIITSL